LFNYATSQKKTLDRNSASPGVLGRCFLRAYFIEQFAYSRMGQGPLPDLPEISIKKNPSQPMCILSWFSWQSLFYGNVFWVFPKIIRYKKGIVRLALGAGWLAMVFGANYFIVGPPVRAGEPNPRTAQTAAWLFDF
jgi:hypothetical protein